MGTTTIGSVATRRRFRVRPGQALTALALAVVVAALFLAVFGEVIAPDDPRRVDLNAGSLGPVSGHLLGTDQLGRDILSRALAGARTAIFGPLIIAASTVVISTVLGLVAGYVGGWTDATLSRVNDIVYALPPLLVAIVVVGVLGGGFGLGIVILVVLNIPASFRSQRAASLEQRGLPYIEAARVLGLSRWRIMRIHVLPNIMPVVSSSFFIAFTYAFVDLSTLSFLGLGVAPGTPDWGRMVAESRILVFENPWAALAPLLLIVATAVSANLVGEAVDDRIAAKGRGR
ncbi:ABC transporter permease [Patulibacter sp.]|uniref:ABC transporter permease n=1 Tax=Patulibacter sp. TaxID=1912859 RepID=UPI0027236ECA|nr:ABC transporter permease [Patulibacter sp.]MDO9409015.1 ABC transporter permease [Patulibacter sp.]